MKPSFHCYCVFILAAIAMLAARAAGQAPSLAAPADPHEHVRKILQRPLYQRWQLRKEEASNSSISEATRREAEKISQWISDFFERMFHRRSSSRTVSSPGLGSSLKTLFWVIAWSAIGLFFIAVIVLIVRLVRDARESTTMSHVLTREQVSAALNEGAALALGGSAWLDEASRLAAEKNFRAMYRALYLALLSGLHSSGKIDFNRHHTNWTYVQRYRGQASEREVFSELTSLFDCVWYGLKESAHPDLASLKQEVQQLIAPAGAGDAHAR